MTKTLLPTISDEMSSEDMKSAKLHFEGLGFSMPGWAKASRERKVAWLRKTLTEASDMWVKHPADPEVAARTLAISDAMATAQHETYVIEESQHLKTIVEKVERSGSVRSLGKKLMDFTAAVVNFVVGSQTSPDTSIPLLGRLMVNAKMNFASGLKRGEPSPANLRAAKRLADHRRETAYRLANVTEDSAEDFWKPVSRQNARYMQRIAAKMDRTERKEEAMASRALGGAAAVV